MLPFSFLVIIFGIIVHKSNASDADLQKLCAGQRYGTLVPNPNDCNSFYVCQFIVQWTKCDIGLHFDRKNKVCNWPQFAGCDWVEAENSSSEDKIPAVKPEKPNTNDDKYPGGNAEVPNKPVTAGEQPLPSEEGSGGKPSGDSGKPNETDKPKPSEEGNVDQQPSEDKTPEDGQTSKESGESKPDGAVTDNDYITPKPQYPPIDPITSPEENPDNQNNNPATVDDFITKEPQTPSPSSAENPDGPSTDDDFLVDEPKTPSPSDAENTDGPSTDDDFLVDEPKTPSPSDAENHDNQHNNPPIIDDTITQTPYESGDQTPSLPIPNHPEVPPSPPINEETDQPPPQGNQETSEQQPPIIEGNDNPGSPRPPNIDESDNKPDVEDGSIDRPTAGGGDHSSHHWNLIASIVSVEASHTDGFINHPTVGAHSPQTGHPVDAMAGYDPKNVKCLHSGLYFLPHPSDCQKYFICAYRHLHLHSCGNGVIWNHKREQCDLKGYARCYSRDADSDDSTELVTPFLDDHTEMTTRKPTSKATKLPTTTPGQKLPICPATRQIYMPHLDDCHKYFICIVGKAVLTSCPSGMHWDAVGEFCGKPSEVRCAHR